MSVDQTPPHASDLLVVEDLTVRYPVHGRRQTVKAVDGVSCSVAEGETFGLIGESGSGKSTIARAVLGLVRPTAGTISFRGMRLDRLRGREQRRMRRHYQMIFQDPHEALDPRMTVRASVAEPLRVQRRGDAGDLVALVDALLGKAGLSAEHAQRRPHELSGGQKQRVNIARALALDPELLVCDEAVSALDVSIQADILNLLAELQREMGLAYLFISHDIGVVSHIADRVAVMYLGVIVERGPVEGVIDSPLHPYTEALLAAEPQAVPAHCRTERPAPLKGELPSPIDPPSGCRFRTRCPYAEDRCAAEVPPLRELMPGRWVACHFAESLDLRGRYLTTAGGR
ncbi:ABC transporter ATP-binding protein [Pseudonocardia nigra]|uniref:ABC transporter ATP-binding protein n=1 Tax=Pseudonocardia nigra TaxID=1921578 RepID=UPI001C5E03FA|nr:ABC transporter ATP-binding protein [Pseudonocardia nigra]